VALLVGVGIGLQQTFNDFFSGILLLFERSIEIGDWVEIDGLVGKVMRIGLRTSIVQTRDNRSVIVPNSKLVVNNVTSWSHGDDVARFDVAVGVAYGSDTELVKNLLLRAAAEQPKVMENPAPFVRMVQFGNSSLDFEIHFWTDEFMFIEDLKSDIRFSIDRLFRENKVVIPFPQSDIWIKSVPNNPPAFE
jgi:small-conductance mechanosensitive channel